VLPKEIIDIPDEYTEEDYNLYITKVDYPAIELTFDLILEGHIYDNDILTKKWTVQTVGHRKNNISFDKTIDIKISVDHPLLWEFTDTQCQLYFTGQSENPEKLFYDLFVTHKKLFKSFQHFNISFGQDTNISSRFQFGNGLLAEGPKKLLEKYADCLIQNGLEYTIIGERPATRWDGDKFSLENTGLKVFTLGDSFVIAQNFIFSPHD
jgi:hypothetical protein